MHPIPKSMVPPSQKRQGIWNNGIIQVQVTRACDLSCHHCSQGSNLAGKPAIMTPDQFDRAVASLEGYWGITGCFGGNPALSPYFEDYCRILRARVPYRQRGLWCNNLRGKGAHARVTFDPSHSNLNVHMNTEAYEEFKRDWPESIPYLKGLTQDSVHGSPWVALKDVESDESKRWDMIGRCDVNQWWSALVGLIRGELRAFFCEIAYSQAALHENNPNWDNTGAPMPDTGLDPAPGWWRQPMAAYEAQVRLHCHACGIPLRRPGQLAIDGEKEEFSATHAFIARPKTRDRAVSFVSADSLSQGPRPDRPATEYLDGTTPKVRQ